MELEVTVSGKLVVLGGFKGEIVLKNPTDTKRLTAISYDVNKEGTLLLSSDCEISESLAEALRIPIGTIGERVKSIRVNTSLMERFHFPPSKIIPDPYRGVIELDEADVPEACSV